MGDALAPWHIVILLIVFMVLFGAKRLPGAAQSLGQALKIFKHETKNLSADDTSTPAAAAPFASNTVITPPQAAQPPLAQPPLAQQQQQQIEQLQRQLNDLQAKTADANGVPLSEAQRNQPG